MTNGELVEILIQVRDGHQLKRTEDDAVCAACNILDKLPRMMDTDAAKAALQEFTADCKRMEAALQDAEETLNGLLGACGQFCDDAIEGYRERKKERESGRKTAWRRKQ